MWIDSMFLKAKFSLSFVDLNFIYVSAAFVSSQKSYSATMSREKKFGSPDAPHDDSFKPKLTFNKDYWGAGRDYTLKLSSYIKVKYVNIVMLKSILNSIIENDLILKFTRLKMHSRANKKHYSHGSICFLMPSLLPLATLKKDMLHGYHLQGRILSSPSKLKVETFYFFEGIYIYIFMYWYIYIFAFIFVSIFKHYGGTRKVLEKNTVLRAWRLVFKPSSITG